MLSTTFFLGDEERKEERKGEKERSPKSDKKMSEWSVDGEGREVMPVALSKRGLGTKVGRF